MSENFTLNFQSAETVRIQMTDVETREALKNSCSFFLNFFLAEELTFDVPEFHVKTWELLTNPVVSKIAAALPRGTAKTTLAKLSVVYQYLFSPARFVVYVSNTVTIAAEACKDIIDYIKSNNFIATFGEPRFEVYQDSRGFYKFWLPYIDDAGQKREKFCILRALGAGQQVRGLNIDNLRPEVAVVDDLEDDDNTATEVLQKKLKKWFYGPFIKAMTRKNPKIVYIGNMLSNRSLLYHFCVNSDEWHSMRFGILLSSGESLWPEMWSLEQIRADFIEYQKLGLIGQWFAEMMNMPIADGNLLIDAEDITYLPPVNPGEQSAAFITIDPAISLKTWADETAICVHAWLGATWQVVDYVKGKFTPDQVFMLALDMCFKWRTRTVGIEMAGYQKALKYLFDILMQVHNQSFSIYEIPHRNRSKLERLAAWCSLIRKKQWALTEGDYAMTEQLLQFDPNKKENIDDLADAGSMGATMVELYMPAIMEAYEIDPHRLTVTHVVSY